MDSLSKLRELELTVQRLSQRVNVLEAQSRPPESAWITPAGVAEASNGKYTEYLIRATVDRAIKSPSGTRLVAGKHYSKVRIGTRWQYKICWPDFDNVLQEESSLED